MEASNGAVNGSRSPTQLSPPESVNGAATTNAVEPFAPANSHNSVPDHRCYASTKNRLNLNESERRPLLAKLGLRNLQWVPTHLGQYVLIGDD